MCVCSYFDFLICKFLIPRQNFTSLTTSQIKMGKKNKPGSGPKANVFKVAGAKSLKKPKAKAVNLGLKNIKQKVADIDKQFLEINKNPKPNQSSKPVVKPPQKKTEKKVTKEDVASTTDKIVKMDL